MEAGTLVQGLVHLGLGFVPLSAFQNNTRCCLVFLCVVLFGLQAWRFLISLILQKTLSLERPSDLVKVTLFLGQPAHPARAVLP